MKMIVEPKVTSKVHQFKRATSGSYGYDLCAVLDKDLELAPGDIVIIPTGVYLELPMCLEAQIRSRSGLSTKGVIVANAPGTIDADYKDEIKVILTNISKKSYIIRHSDRIAQMTFNPIFVLGDIAEQERNGGFGSTGR